MRKILLSLPILLGTFINANAEGCDGILSLTRNLSFETKSINVASQLHREYCEGTSVKSGKSFSLGLDMQINQVPVGLNLGSGSTKDKIQQLCSLYDSWFVQNQQQVALAISTDDKAIAAWQRCKELEGEDVFFTVDPQAELVAFGVRRGRGIIDFLGMNYLRDQLVCTGPVGTNGREVEIDTETRFTLTEATELPITCRRKYMETPDGIRYLPAAEVSISAQGAAPLIIPLPREERYEPSLASDIRERLQAIEKRADQLQTLVDQANQRITALQQSLNGYVAHGTRVQLKSDEGYLFSNDRQNKDPNDVLIYHTPGQYTQWTINPAQ